MCPQARERNLVAIFCLQQARWEANGKAFHYKDKAQPSHSQARWSRHLFKTQWTHPYNGSGFISFLSEGQGSHELTPLLLDIWGGQHQESTLAALTKINPLEVYSPQAGHQD